jgi:hypothetical protein
MAGEKKEDSQKRTGRRGQLEQSKAYSERIVKI